MGSCAWRAHLRINITSGCAKLHWLFQISSSPMPKLFRMFIFRAVPSSSSSKYLFVFIETVSAYSVCFWKRVTCLASRSTINNFKCSCLNQSELSNTVVKTITRTQFDTSIQCTHKTQTSIKCSFGCAKPLARRMYSSRCPYTSFSLEKNRNSNMLSCQFCDAATSILLYFILSWILIYPYTIRLQVLSPYVCTLQMPLSTHH